MKTITSITLIGFTLFAFGLSTEAFCQTNADNQLYASVSNASIRNASATMSVTNVLTTPRISLVPESDGMLIHILNPELAPLTFQIKDAKEHLVEAWASENFDVNDAKQALNVSDLKPGIYSVEISSPQRQSMSIKWEKK